MAEPEFDLQAAHKHFSITCFNKTWELMEKESRTPEEDMQMIQLSTSSLWHWTQRNDCASNNLFGGNWQISRVYAILGNGSEALKYADLALQFGKQAGPFHEAYGYEALARAEHVAGNTETARRHIQSARTVAARVEDENRARCSSMTSIRWPAQFSAQPIPLYNNLLALSPSGAPAPSANIDNFSR